MWLSFSYILDFPLFPPSLHNTCSCYYLHSQIDSDKDSVFWLVNLHPSFLPSWKKNRMHFYSIQVHSSFLIQVSCMVYTIKKLEFKKLEWRLGCKTCIVYTGLKMLAQRYKKNDVKISVTKITISLQKDYNYN